MSEPIKARRITKSRLIAALMAELDAAQALVLARCPESGQVMHRTLQCSFRVPFHESEIKMSIPDQSITVMECVCCYAGQRIAFQIKKIGDDSWGLPEEMSLIELRHQPRMAFAERMYSAEIVSERQALYGYAVDVNREYLAIDIDAPHKLQVGEEVKVIIRLVNTNCDVFFSRCRVARNKQLSDQDQRLILLLGEANRGQVEERRYERRLVQSASIVLEGTPFTDSQESLSLAIHNISMGGMTVALRHREDQKRMIPGLLLQSSELKTTFLVVWTHQELMGIRPILADANDLARWYRYVDQVAPPESRQASLTRKELAQLLTHSGLLKGERRSPFGRGFEDHIVSSSQIESPLLIQRYIITDNNQNRDQHICVKRISDYSWLLNDGLSLSDTGSFTALLDSNFEKIVRLASYSPLYCRYLTGIWHESIKPSVEWGNTIEQKGHGKLFDAFHFSIRAFHSHPINENILDIDFAWTLSAKERRNFSLKFHPLLFDSIVSGDGHHPILNSELHKLGPYHNAMTKILKINGVDSLFAHRVNTHNIWSSTGVSNSLFIILPDDFALENLGMCIKHLADDDISFGTDDVLVIVGNKSNDEVYSALKNQKKFFFLVSDLLLNEENRFQDKKEEKIKRKTAQDNKS